MKKISIFTNQSYTTRLKQGCKYRYQNNIDKRQNWEISIRGVESSGKFRKLCQFFIHIIGILKLYEKINSRCSLLKSL